MTAPFDGKRILLGVSGSIAVYKAVDLASKLTQAGALVDVLDQPRKLSPFYWSDSSHVLISGFDWLRAIGMLLVAGAFLALAVWSFQRREVSSGGKEVSLKWLRRRHENNSDSSVPAA